MTEWQNSAIQSPLQTIQSAFTCLIGTGSRLLQGMLFCTIEKNPSFLNNISNSKVCMIKVVKDEGLILSKGVRLMYTSFPLYVEGLML